MPLFPRRRGEGSGGAGLLSVFLAIAAIVLLGGCRERREPSSPLPPATAATSGSRPSHVQERSETVAPASIGRISPAELRDAIASVAPCSFDSVGDTYFERELDLAERHSVLLRGWLSDEREQVPSKFRLLLKGAADTFAIPASTGVPRPDVAAHFKNQGLASAGFNFITDLSAVPPGTYQVWLAYSDGNALKYCDTSKRLKF